MEAPEYYQRANFEQKASSEHFVIEELLDFSNEENVDAFILEGTFESVTGNSTESSTVTALDSCNSSGEPQLTSDLACQSFTDGRFSSDLCVPYDDLAELEWLSNIVEESFSTEDLQNLELISGMKARNTLSESHEFLPENNRNSPIFRPEVSVPGKARSKRSRAAPGNWTSRLLVLSPTTSSSSDSDVGKKQIKGKKREGFDNNSTGEERKCLHCATDKTPQWRTGPLGPKTLCNACGVRYKSGRLVPEYRPAASPTFMLTKHSNSHRKVLELRRQKELQRVHQAQQQHQFVNPNMIFEVTNGDDYLIHQHVGPTFGQLI